MAINFTKNIEDISRQIADINKDYLHQTVSIIEQLKSGSVQNKITNINPTFNSLLMWHMKNNEGPLHAVEKVTSSKLRVSLVGFYAEI